MFNKLKDGVQGAKDKVNEIQDKQKQEKQQKWVKEITAENQDFKEVQQWFDLYEPKKEKKEKKEDNSGDSAMKQKVMGMIAASISKNVVKNVMEALAYAVEFAAKKIEKSEPKYFHFMNSLTAACLTFRFEDKNKDKFTYIRGITIDRIAFTLIQVIDSEAAKLGKTPDQIDQKTIDQLVQQITTKVTEEITKQQQVAVDKFKASPLFQATGVSGQQVDEGVQLIIQAIQQYGEKKIGVLIKTINTVLPVVLNCIAKHQQAIRANLGSKAGAEPSQEYVTKTRQQIEDSINGYHKQLFDFVNNFISGFFGVINNSSEE